MPLRFDILTTFPEMFSPDAPAALGVSIPARARAAGLVEWHATDIRAHAANKHQKTDDRPFGGGPGMVMMCQPLWDAVHAAEALDPRPATRVLLTPQGRRLDQSLVEDLAAKPRLLLVAGHYEGIDERVIQKLEPLELSLGDYVLSGGELAALVLMDAVIRLLPGALGDEGSSAADSFSRVVMPELKKKAKSREIGGQSCGVAKTEKGVVVEAGGTPAPRDGVGAYETKKPSVNLDSPAPAPPTLRLLDCPHYTKPREWMGLSVPEVLLSGDHAKIAAWRLEQMLERTRERRPDLLA